MKNSKFNIAIIGAGQLGSRHLQGLAKISLPCCLEVMDPFDTSLKVAEERYLQIPKNENIQSIKFVDSIEQMSDNHDLVIIATTADIRLEVVKKLLEISKVKNILLEKVVFQSEEDFIVADNLFKQNNVSVWVNCVRRITPAYQEIKKYFKNSQIKSCKYTLGDQWGLGSNSLHFIDCISYLCDCDDYSLDGSQLNDVVTESKRPGFMEFSGTLSGTFANRINFEVTAVADSDLPVKLEIISDNVDVCVCETEKKYLVTEKNTNSEVKEFPFAVPFQSELSNLTADDILIKGKCNLPDFQESYKLHIPLLKAFTALLERVKGVPFPKCPIT
jgi:predicted dehydrogenase